jgi:hypothetical protein
MTDRPASLSFPLAAAMLAAVYCLPLLGALTTVADPDLWWHLSVGRWVAEHGRVPEADPFAGGRPWVAYSWLFEVLVDRLYAWLGLTGILGYRALLGLAVVAAFHRLVRAGEPRFLVSTALAAVAALALIPLLSERPWLFTILFTTLTLHAVLELRRGRRGLAFWLLPAVFALWANLHIQFVYGAVVLGIGCVAPLIDRLLGRDPGIAPRDWGRLVGLTAVCLGATLCNPYGVRLYGVVWEYATQPLPFDVMNELMALDFRAGWDWLVLALALATAFALGRRPRLTAFDVLLFAACAVLCFRARRDLWLVVLAALVYLPRLVPPVPSLASTFRPGLSGGIVVGAVVIAVALWLVRARGLTEEMLRQRVAAAFPERAALVVRERGYAGTVYNHLNWGGYLMWRLPGLEVVIDGRTNLHGEARIRRSLKTWAGGSGWHDDAELLGADLVLAESTAPLAALLRLDPRFREVYDDGQASLFLPRR